MGHAGAFAGAAPVLVTTVAPTLFPTGPLGVAGSAQTLVARKPVRQNPLRRSAAAARRRNGGLQETAGTGLIGQGLPACFNAKAFASCAIVY